MDANTWLIVFVGLTCVAILIQAGVLLGMYLTVRKCAKMVEQLTGDMKTTVLPVVHSSRDLLERISPQIAGACAGIAEITELVKKETNGAKVSLSDITGRVQSQVKRIDGMLTTALDTVGKTATVVEHSVAAPVRLANGVIAAIKAVIDTYRKTPGAGPYEGPFARRTNIPDPDRDVVI